MGIFTAFPLFILTDLDLEVHFLGMVDEPSSPPKGFKFADASPPEQEQWIVPPDQAELWVGDGVTFKDGYAIAAPLFWIGMPSHKLPIEWATHYFVACRYQSTIEGKEIISSHWPGAKKIAAGNITLFVAPV